MCASLHGKFQPVCFVSLGPSPQTLVALAAAARRNGGGSHGTSHDRLGAARHRCAAARGASSQCVTARVACGALPCTVIIYFREERFPQHSARGAGSPVEFRRGLPTTESPAESRKGPCEGLPSTPLASGRGEECARRAWWRRNDAFLLVDGRSRRALRSLAHFCNYPFLVLIFSSRTLNQKKKIFLRRLRSQSQNRQKRLLLLFQS